MTHNLDEVRENLAAAMARREGLREQGLTCYRLLNGYGEGIDGLIIDRYGSAAVIRFRSDCEPLLGLACDALEPDFDLVTARRRGVGSHPRALHGTLKDERVVVEEEPLSFLVNFARAGNPGLFLDTREARSWLRKNSEGLRVLNLFSFTGSLGIAAAVGGARSVTHVDSHGPTLKWARANCDLNQLTTDDRDFARMNVYQHMRKNSSGRQRYGGIIIDPPPGPRTPQGKDRTPGPRGVLALAPKAARMLEPGGWMLCFLHHDERPREVIEAEIASETGLEIGWRGGSGIDFPEHDESLRLRITAFVRAAA